MIRNADFREEEGLMTRAYTAFEAEIQAAAQKLREKERIYEEGRYDDHTFQIVAADVTSARKAYQASEKTYTLLYDQPYFSHITLHDDTNDEECHCFLSDSPYLDETFYIDQENRNYSIIPFKYSTDPLSTHLRILSAAPSAQPISLDVLDTRFDTKETTVYSPQLVRRVDIFRKQLNEVQTQLDVREDAEAPAPDSDEFLARRLEENRTDSQLRNIISTLQQQQFEIIRTDIGMSFIVQGCAGSGKSQCLLHRLFFLREALSERGWERVLLIAPTQLFRSYSSALMQRYRLTDIANCTIADLYERLLSAYDPRFRSRQYTIEPSEEYLPDAYLRQVYAPEHISHIEGEIARAIRAHYQEACDLLEIACDPDETVTIEKVDALDRQIEAALRRYDETEKAFAEDPEYLRRRGEIDRLDRELKAYQRRLTEQSENREKLSATLAQFEALSAEVQRADEALAAFDEQTSAQIAALNESLTQRIQALDAARDIRERIPLTHAFMEAWRGLCDAALPGGSTYNSNEVYRTCLKDEAERCRGALQEFTGRQSAAAWKRNYDHRMAEYDKRIAEYGENIQQTEMVQEDHRRWMEEHNVEEAAKQRKAHRDALEHAHYYLSRMESSVFEQEVWNANAQLKTECGIETMKIDTLAGNHQKQTRILYKSDLLFYVHIYAALHTTAKLPVYELICIDEGQDLHSADYALLRRLYPKARFNVFGDTMQTLHESCGISRWQAQTGIGQLYEMNVNYRNTPAIVDFCNRKFDERMESVGKIQPEQMPVMLEGKAELRSALNRRDATVIVRDRAQYQRLLSDAGLNESDLPYIDTRAENMPEDSSVCFSIFAAKGLEFPNALIYAKGMTRNQKIVACTRAMKNLYYFE